MLPASMGTGLNRRNTDLKKERERGVRERGRGRKRDNKKKRHTMKMLCTMHLTLYQQTLAKIKI